jgi:hypothetical protein
MKKNIAIILVLILAVAAVLYFVYDQKNNAEAPEQAVADPNYVEYVDAANHVKLMHHKDWQAASSTGFIRLSPKMSQGEVKYVQIELWATDAKVSQLGFDAANSAPVGSRVVRYVNQEIPWKDSQGKTTAFETTKTYMHWPATSERNVVFEVSPGVLMGNIEEPVKKIVDSLKFD